LAQIAEVAYLPVIRKLDAICIYKNVLIRSNIYRCSTVIITISYSGITLKVNCGDSESVGISFVNAWGACLKVEVTVFRVNKAWIAVDIAFTAISTPDITVGDCWIGGIIVVYLRAIECCVPPEDAVRDSGGGGFIVMDSTSAATCSVSRKIAVGDGG